MFWGIFVRLNSGQKHRESTNTIDMKRQKIQKLLLVALMPLLGMGILTSCKDSSTQEFQKTQNELFQPKVDPGDLMKETPESATADSTAADSTDANPAGEE